MNQKFQFRGDVNFLAVECFLPLKLSVLFARSASTTAIYRSISIFTLSTVLHCIELHGRNVWLPPFSA